MTSPHSIHDRIYSIFREHIPGRNKALFLALLDLPQDSLNPKDPREPNPSPESVLVLLDAIDTLLDPLTPMPDELREARGALRRACLDQLSKVRQEQMRANARKKRR